MGRRRKPVRALVDTNYSLDPADPAYDPTRNRVDEYYRLDLSVPPAGAGLPRRVSQWGTQAPARSWDDDGDSTDLASAWYTDTAGDGYADRIADDDAAREYDAGLDDTDSFDAARDVARFGVVRRATRTRRGTVD